jgi:hypothetical protein
LALAAVLGLALSFADGSIASAATHFFSFYHFVEGLFTEPTAGA